MRTLMKLTFIQSVYFATCVMAGNALAAEDGWPGLPPDCWTENRNVHSGESVDIENLTSPRVEFSHVDEPGPGERVFSPNNGYYFIAVGFRPESTVLIYSEKARLWKLEFEDVFYPARPTWISENLLFVRVWPGRIAFIDMILNVETEEIVYTERGTDAYLAMQQYQGYCANNEGCACMEQQ